MKLLHLSDLHIGKRVNECSMLEDQRYILEQIAQLAMGQMTSSLGVAVGVFYVVMPLCGVLNMLYTVLNIAALCQGNGPDATKEGA